MTNPTREAVIVDVDGTLCNVSTALRHLPDYRAFHAASRQCPPTAEVIDWCGDHHDAGRVLAVVTGRKYEHESLTRDWLGEHLPYPFVGPFMRGDDDARPDTEVKADIAAMLRDDHGLHVVGAIDDRPSVIRLWARELGIPTTVVYRPDWLANGETYDDLADLPTLLDRAAL
ncbi:polynucleotide kinase [Gordonia phage Mariokart]|nr:polynucleotide kinase [Gordonia phage Mariokart]